MDISSSSESSNSLETLLGKFFLLQKDLLYPQLIFICAMCVREIVAWCILHELSK
jgi:hypothetical protein